MSFRGRGGYRRGGGGYHGRGGGGFSGAPWSDLQGDSGFSESFSELRKFFASVEGCPYGQLKRLTGASFDLSSNCQCTFLAIQSDPFAPGSQICVTCPCPFNIEKVLQSGDVRSAVPCRRVAAEDYILRSFYNIMHKSSDRYRSNALQILRPSQHVLHRSTVSIQEKNGGGAEIQVYLRVKIPGHGRRIDGHGSVRIFYDELLCVAERAITGLDKEHIFQHVTCVHDQEYLRGELEPAGLVAFVNNGAVLPRDAGDSDKPLRDGALPFVSPPSLERSFTLPQSGVTVTGMGIPRGLTLIAGGGFHGKSTLLRAMEIGIYNHVPGDGREYVVVDPSAVKIRAEDRRSISGVDISPFISNLPFKKDTTAFSTSDASGSTSQAANIIESLELGSQLLLFDEDTCATNLLFRDASMQMLVPREQEPITTFLERVSDLVQNHGISSIMVVGGSGQYFSQANVVLVMNAYRTLDCTARAKEIAAGSPSALIQAPSLDETVFVPSVERTFDGRGTFSTVRYRKGRDEIKVSGAGTDTVRFSEESIDLSLVEQIVEEGQVNAIAQCLAMLFDEGESGIDATTRSGKSLSYLPSASGGCSQRRGAFCSDFSSLIQGCEARLHESVLEMRTPSCYLPRGFTTAARRFEIGAALNRLRTLRTFAASLK